MKGTIYFVAMMSEGRFDKIFCQIAYNIQEQHHIASIIIRRKLKQTSRKTKVIYELSSVEQARNIKCIVFVMSSFLNWCKLNRNFLILLLVTCGSSSPTYVLPHKISVLCRICILPGKHHSSSTSLLWLQYRNGLCTKQNMVFYIKWELLLSVLLMQSVVASGHQSLCSPSQIPSNKVKSRYTHLHVSMFIGIRFHACLVLKQSQTKYFQTTSVLLS